MAQKHAQYSNDIVLVEGQISQLKAEKHNLTAQQDDLRQQLMNAEMKNGSKGVMDRGAEGFAQYDAYIKQIRIKLLEAREQKRHTELQLMDITQRLNAKRLRREMAEKNRVTDATITLMEEICNQLSFLDHLETFIGRVNNEYLESSFLERVKKLSSLFSMLCDSICAVLSKVPAAHDSVAVLCGASSTISESNLLLF
jgi:chromosome segregation ATPase